MKQRALMGILCLLFTANLFGQKLKFDIMLGDKKIGEITAEQKDSAGMVCYRVHSRSDVNIFFTQRSSDMHELVCFDKQGNLVYSSYENIKSDGNIITKVTKNKDQLLVDMNGTQSLLKVPVNMATVLLYFNEPQKLQGILSERAGKLLDLTKEPDGAYVAKLDGGMGRYTYKNGKLVQLELSKGMLGSVLIKAVM